MMFDNFSLNLLAGGFYRTTPRWNKGSESQDSCYKCYLSVRGRAKVVTAEGSYTIQSGAMYFILGFHLKSQSCEREMTVHWIHFTPDSFLSSPPLEPDSRCRRLGIARSALAGTRFLSHQ